MDLMRPPGSATDELSQVDLVLINTPIHDYGTYPHYKGSYSTPVGLVLLATELAAEGFAVEILDAEALQLSPSEIAEHVKRRAPRACGVNAFSVNFELSARILRALPADTTTILGGPHATLSSKPHLVSYFSFVDFIVRGDGEIAIVEILKEVVSRPRKKKRLAPSFREHTVDSLDTLKVPDRSRLSNEPYTRNGKRFVDLTMSRGCIFRCAFCAGSCKSNGSAYRTRSLQLVRSEIETLRAEMQIEGIEIVDDLPFQSRPAIERFFSEVVDRLQFDLEWDFNLPLQLLRTLSPGVFSRLRASGVQRMTFGIESGDEAMRRSMGKPLSDAEVFELVSQMTSTGFETKGYFVIGFPGETCFQIQKTVAMATTLAETHHQFSPRMFIFKPFPGSALWPKLLSDGYSEDDLLQFVDFELDREYFNKHAWAHKASFCEMSHPDLRDTVNQFYNSIGWQNGSGGHK